MEDLRAQLEGVKETLEVETLGKVDLQNNMQSLKEELAFRKKVYEEVLCAFRLIPIPLSRVQLCVALAAVALV